MRRSILLLLLTLTANLLLAQTAPFVKGYMVRSDPMYTVHNFRQTRDHGFILATDNILSAPNSSGVSTFGCLIKLDAAGQTQWSVQYPKLCVGSPSDANAVVQAADGGYAVATLSYFCAGTFAGQGSILLIRTDSTGAILWSTTFAGAGTCYPNCVEATSDNGFIIAGSTRDTITHVVSYFMIKTDSLGQLQWEKTYNSSIPGSLYGIFYSVIETHDGGYMAVGHGLDTCNYGTVIRLDSNGDVIWSRKTVGVLSFCFDVAETDDHHYVVAGKGPNAVTGYQEHRIYKLDDLGNTLLSQAIIMFGSDQLSSVVVEDDGYTFAGICDTG